MKQTDDSPARTDAPVSVALPSGVTAGGCGSAPAQPDAPAPKIDSKKCFDALIEH